jgi:hypothetical protein
MTLETQQAPFDNCHSDWAGIGLQKHKSNNYHMKKQTPRKKLQPKQPNQQKKIKETHALKKKEAITKSNPKLCRYILIKIKTHSNTKDGRKKGEERKEKKKKEEKKG